jgi:hypothetical protein
VNSRSGNSDLRHLTLTWRGCRNNPGTGSLADPFAENPIRRSFALVVTCVLIVVVPWMISDAAMTTVMLSIGWLAVSGLVMGVPILIWSLAELGLLRLRGKIRPGVEQLEVSERLKHLLVRHGYETIAQVESSPDADLILLSNMDAKGLRDIRRAVVVWRYRRWQERGFPAEGV